MSKIFQLIVAYIPMLRAFRVIGGALTFVAACGAIILLPSPYAAIGIGVLLSVGLCFVVLVATPRAAQLTFFGAALGVTADGTYARFTDQTPVTLANGLVRLADSLIKAAQTISNDGVPIQAGLIPTGVWSFMFCTIVIMAASFLVKHDG